jgi:hypothetical protein
MVCGKGLLRMGLSVSAIGRALAGKVRLEVSRWRGAYYRYLREKSRQTLDNVATGARVSIATVHRAERGFNSRSKAHRRIASYLTGRDVA